LGLIEGVSLLLKGRSLEEGLQASKRMIEKKGQTMEVDVTMSSVDIEILMASYVEENTSQGEGRIFDFSSTVHVYFYKEIFSSLVAMEEGTVKMVDDSACKIIDTETVNVTCRDGTVHALEVVCYVPEARYNLISIEMLDEEGCWIQV